MADEFESALEGTEPARRSFLKKLAVGSAFAAPVVSSFTMTGIKAVYAQTPNVSGQVQGGQQESTSSTTATTAPNQTTTTESTTTTTQGNEDQATPPVPAGFVCAALRSAHRSERGHAPRRVPWSLDGLVDEIVVVDTGSTDTSVAVAEQHGSQVAHEPWAGDFARARNRSLDLARGDWVLYVDADERVRCADRPAVRAWLDRDTVSVAFRVRFVPRVGWTPYREYRLWRNRSDIRFRGAMHESIVAAVAGVAASEGLQVVPFDLFTIEHVGYEGDQSAKHARDEPMLLDEIERRPDRSYLYDHLARIYEAQGDSPRAIATWQRGIAVARARGCSHPDDLLVYVDLIFHRLAQGPLDNDLGALIVEALGAFARTPTLELAAARYEFATGDPSTAAARVEWLLSLDPDGVIDTGSSYDRRVFGEWAWDLLGLCRFALGDDDGAAEAFRRAETLAPQTEAYAVRRRLAEARAQRRPRSDRAP